MADRDTDPDSGGEEPARKTYECSNCGHRIQAEHQPGTCPECGGELTDISVSRE
ncbi:rubrerythrin-like domain-containing protein [Saliphagus sp. GCM10025334]